MTPREIVAAAWSISTRERLLWRWGFMESFFQTLLNIKLLGYQAYFIYQYYHGEEAGLFDDFIWIYERTSAGFTALVVAFFAILLVVEFLMPHLTEGAIIGLSAKSYRGEEVKGGLVLAVYNFFPLFALHELFILSGWTTALSASSLSLRYLPEAISFTAVIIIASLWTITNFFKFFTLFAQQGIVLKKEGIFQGMARSYKLMLSHIGHIFFLLVLLLIISLRVIINTVVIFLIPAAAMGLVLLLTYFFSPLVSYLIGGTVALGMVVLVSYFLAYLHIFRQTVWTLTYIELNKHKELDSFEE